MSNPFKKIASNSKETKNSNQWKGAKTRSTTVSKICSACGAPRPKRTDLRVCAYCGLEFMTIDKTIHPDI